MSKQIKLLLLGAILATVFFLIFFLDKKFLTAKLNEYNLLPKPEAFSELYFEDHQKLPVTLEATQEAKFRFTVHNMEYKPYQYEYEIESVSTQSSKLITKGSFVLQNDEYKTISSKVSSEEARVRTKINVNLKNKNQSIHFWVNGN